MASDAHMTDGPLPSQMADYLMLIVMHHMVALHHQAGAGVKTLQNLF